MNLRFIARVMDNFRLKHERENYKTVIENIESGVVFKGTNLWVLIFAIFIASLGLNVNSTAVIIGAMLISPLMGPIMGTGLGLAINDVPLLTKSIRSFSFAVLISLATSTLYFTLSPIEEVHSEILARTSPNIYDVLIAFFGGLAGVLASSSKLKGNVIPGVAIATALMPPLCTAGFGLATLQWKFFFGAFYLFTINTVFIALATLLTVRFLKFPVKHFVDKKLEKKTERLIMIITIITLLPSIYFGYKMVQGINFEKQAAKFIFVCCRFPNDYLLQQRIDANERTITLTYGGQQLSNATINAARASLVAFGLDNTTLEIKQGFAFEKGNTNELISSAEQTLLQRDAQLRLLQTYRDSMQQQENKMLEQVFKELKINYPTISTAIIQPARLFQKDTTTNVLVCIVHTTQPVQIAAKTKIENWLKLRLNTQQVALIAVTK